MSTRPTRFRADIQGLRAVAVGGVVVYHLWPHALPGGFAGVDVFFVISGFLITSHLLQHPPSGGRDLVAFWSRRIRRLLPAALLVLLATLAASRVVAPESQWENTARQARAAALYVVNWLLAGDAVDYLNADADPSPVQHFWSLSVEEQFYAGWPVLLLLLVALARVTRRPLGPVVVAGSGAVVAASLAWSVHLTATDPASAYFVTTTRVWELGIGAVLAAWAARHALSASRHPDPDPTDPHTPRRRGDRSSAILALVGLAMIAVTFATYDAETPFPGWRALLPTVGAAVVIAATVSAGRSWLARLVAVRPVQWLGDISYSVYLWHWPLLVLLPAVSDGSLGWLDKTAVVLATLVLAHLTKVLVEDRFRTWRPRSPLRFTYLAAVAGMAVVVAAAVQVREVRDIQDAANTRLAAALHSGSPCLGAAALDPQADCPAPSYDSLVLPPSAADDDLPLIYPRVKGGRDCQSQPPDFPDLTCVFGDKNADTTVMVVGNSHAGQWLPALQVLARERHWRLELRISSGCTIGTMRQNYETEADTDACVAWGERTMKAVADSDADLVFMSWMMTWGVDGKDLDDSVGDYEKGVVPALEAWRDAGVPIVLVRDTPAPGSADRAPDCVAEHPDDLDACTAPLADWLPPDPWVTALRTTKVPNIDVIDLTSHICAPKRCSDVVGDVIVWFDRSHLSATYSKTLAPYLFDALRKVGKAP